jgi:hypothetical protein
MQLSGNPTAVFIRAAKAWDARVPFEDEDLLEAYLEYRTQLAEGSDVEEALQIAAEHPGYLMRGVGTQTVFVPFNLASVSPKLQDLECAIEIGRGIRMSDQGAFCLSGSSTFTGRLGIGGDLDFSEYRLDVDAEVADRVLAKAASNELLLIWVKVGAEPLCAPWSNIAAALAPPIERLKLDFVSRSRLGILPTTSVVLATEDGEHGAANQSFAYQEAIILGEPVRMLYRPDRLGAYVSWLKREIEAILAGNSHYDGLGAPIKALKRCLSLLLMLDRTIETEDIINELQDSALSDIVLDARLEELERMAADMTSAPDWLTAEIARLQTRESFGGDRRAAAATSATNVAQRLYELVNVLFAEAA